MLNAKRSNAVKLWAQFAGLLLLFPSSQQSQSPSKIAQDELRIETERNVRTLSSQFEATLAPTAREIYLPEACRINCAAAADERAGNTVGEELDNLNATKRAKLDKISAGIQQLISEFIVGTVSTKDANLDRVSVANDLRQILATLTIQGPKAFVLDSHDGRALIVFYALSKGTMGEHSTTTVLSAYDAGAASLKFSSSAASDMDGYWGLEVKKLHAPTQNEIWFLMSGYMTGANGPNNRMRVFAYDGRQFRTVWAPANVWGAFTTQVTRNGFIIDGQYYRTSRKRHDEYSLAADGLYLANK
jgi:hypothetical protein